jgi:hypothetical protein
MQIFNLRPYTATSDNTSYRIFIASLSHPMTSNSRKAKAREAKVFSTVEGSHKLLGLIQIATSTPRKATFIRSLLDYLPSAFGSSDKLPDDLFADFTRTFGTFPNSKTSFPQTAAALDYSIYRLEDITDNRFKKREFISDLGLDWNADDKSRVISKVNSPWQCYWEILISLIG